MSTHSSSLAWRIPWMEELFLESRNEVMELCRVTINTDTGLTNIHLILLRPTHERLPEILVVPREKTPTGAAARGNP